MIVRVKNIKDDSWTGKPEALPLYVIDLVAYCNDQTASRDEVVNLPRLDGTLVVGSQKDADGFRPGHYYRVTFEEIDPEEL